MGSKDFFQILLMYPTFEGNFVYFYGQKLNKELDFLYIEASTLKVDYYELISEI